MNKQELIKELQECLRLEEESIPIYIRHVQSTFFLSEFSPEERTQMNKSLDQLLNETLLHQKLFINLMEKIERSEKDVY